MSHPSLHTHIPECNSSVTQIQMLCRSNRAYPVNADTHYM